MRRRPLLGALPLLALQPPAAAGPDTDAGSGALVPRPLVFPRDHGAHPDLRTEWWYITGHVQAGERLLGFQVTFFRTRVEATQRMQSRFAARQLVFAHAAVTDVQGARLWHDQRIARAGSGLAHAGLEDADLRLRDWSLQRGSQGTTGPGQGSLPPSGGGRGAARPAGHTEVWQTRISARDFSLALDMAPTQPLLLQGQDGLSRKGPEARQASWYYSLPQLEVTGRIGLQGRSMPVSGRAWLDHEWSWELLHPQAVGWDWIGMNLDDGSALMAFRLRRADGTALWDGGSFRTAAGALHVGSRGENVFSPQRRWTSPLSGASYPVEWLVRTPADIYTVRALVDNQELDSRMSTGAFYWEGLADLLDSNGRRVGRGYLEMTGYARPLRI